MLRILSRNCLLINAKNACTVQIVREKAVSQTPAEKSRVDKTRWLIEIMLILFGMD